MSKRVQVHDRGKKNLDAFLLQMLLLAMAGVIVALSVMLDERWPLLLLAPLAVMAVLCKHHSYLSYDHVVFYEDYAKQSSLYLPIAYKDIAQVYVGSYVLIRPEEKPYIDPSALYIICLDDQGRVRLQIHYTEELWQFFEAKCGAQAADIFHSHYKNDTVRKVVLDNANRRERSLDRVLAGYGVFLE